MNQKSKLGFDTNDRIEMSIVKPGSELRGADVPVKLKY